MSQVELGTPTSRGLAFDVILEPPKSHESPCITPRSKARAGDYADKMQQAESRKQVKDAERLICAKKNRQRAQEAVERLYQEVENMKHATQDKIEKKSEQTAENRQARIAHLRSKLQARLKKVEDVYIQSKAVTEDLEERLKRKYEQAEAKRREILSSQVAKVKEHATSQENLIVWTLPVLIILIIVCILIVLALLILGICCYQYCCKNDDEEIEKIMNDAYEHDLENSKVRGDSSHKIYATDNSAYDNDDVFLQYIPDDTENPIYNTVHTSLQDDDIHTEVLETRTHKR